MKILTLYITLLNQEENNKNSKKKSENKKSDLHNALDNYSSHVNMITMDDIVGTVK